MSEQPQVNQVPSAGPETDWIGLAREAFQASSSYFDANVRRQIEADLRQSQGQHPVGSKYLADKSRSRLFRPKTRALIRKNEAACAEAFFTTNDVVAIKAEDDSNPVQQASAAVMRELLQYRLTKTIPWYLTLVGAFQDAQTVGIACSYQYWEYNAKKGIDRPAVRLVPVENLRFDPGASWTDPVGTSPYLIELIPMYVGQVKARMNAIDPKTGAPKWKMLPDATILTATTTYGDTIRMQREGQRTDSKYQPQANSNFNVVWVHKIIVEVDEVDYVYYTLGCEYLLTDPVPLDQMYFHGQRPYVIGTTVVETHKNYPASLPSLTHDVQAEINEVANQRIDNVKLALNKRYFARRNKQVDLRSVTRNVPGSVTLMQDIDDVKVVEFNDVTGSSYKEQEVLNLDFDDLAGTFSGSSVQSNRKLNETVGGMNLLNTSANQVANYQLRTFVETWVEPVLRQIVLLEQHYETDETILALCGQAAKLQKFGMDAVTDEMLMAETTLSVNVGMGQTNPAEQVKQFISGMTAVRDLLSDGSLMRMGVEVGEVIKEIFGKLGYKDGSRFFSEDGQDDPARKQMQAQIDQLQQALDAKMPPQLLEATVRKMQAEAERIGADTKSAQAAAVKLGVEASFSAMQGAEVIAAVPGVAPIADELMRSAGYTPPTPAGVDPNFPQPGAPAGGLAVNPVKSQRTGIEFTPGDPSTTLYPHNPAQPATPGVGERQGIETQRPDSIQQAAFADGGLVGDDDYDNDGGVLAGYGMRRARASGPYDAGSSPVHDLMAGSMFRLADGGLVGAGRPNADLLSGFNPLQQVWNSGTQAVQSGPDRLLNAYDGLSNQYPKTKLLLDVLPGTGTVTSALDTASDLNKGNYADAAVDAIGLVPALKFAKAPAMGIGKRAVQYVSDNRHWLDAAMNSLPEYLGKVAQPTLAAPGSDPAQNEQLQVYADGGLIRGPGTGTSDSIAAAAGGAPVAVSNGEYKIPAVVVQALGQDFFDKLVEQFHTPVGAAGGFNPPQSGQAPVPLANGDFIVPADVVQALGHDFFDKLVETYGGQG